MGRQVWLLIWLGLGFGNRGIAFAQSNSVETIRQLVTSGISHPFNLEDIEAILEATKQRWNIASDSLLMTGMSDGGTFTFMSGLGASSPFTHLAPIAASFHVMMMEVIGPANIKDRPIYLTHGLHDWMLDVDIARVARDVLAEAGAEVVYREIPDLAHTYPRDENAKILDWFLA